MKACPNNNSSVVNFQSIIIDHTVIEDNRQKFTLKIFY